MPTTKKYQPSNGTEGSNFVDAHCMKCVFCDPDPQGERQCFTLADSMAFSVDAPEYPEEWTFTADGKPTCTKRQAWDWEADGEPELPIYDPNQVSIFDIIEETHK